jgi:polyribonucleotide nucleotidyltransferase
MFVAVACSEQPCRFLPLKVKLVIGAGGDKIKFIQRKTKCRIQVQNTLCECKQYATLSVIAQLCNAQSKLFSPDL